MKRFISGLSVLLLAFVITSCSEMPPTGAEFAPDQSVTETGNGAPSGAHYNLNLIGVTKGKTADMTDNSGHRIFVPLWGNAKIYLAPGDYFQVLDANGTDGDGARFQLPNPDPDGDGTTSYSVYVRALGKPGGKAKMQSCYLSETGEEWCAAEFPEGVEPITIERTNGKQKFENVSEDLLYVDVCVAWDAGEDTILGNEDDVCLDVDQLPLFSDETLGYLWDYQNEGLKLAQLRFYEIPTVTPWTDNSN